MGSAVAQKPAGSAEEQRLIAHLYRTYGPALRRYARTYLRSEADAEDVVQEVFIRICRRGDLDSIHAPSAVLFKTAFRLTLNEIRRRRASILHGAADLQGETLPDIGKSPEDQVIAKAEFLKYCQAVSELPPQCRRVVTLRQVYGYSFKEIGAEMGLSVSTLEKHMGRGKRVFQDAFQAEPQDALAAKRRPNAGCPRPEHFDTVIMAAE